MSYVLKKEAQKVSVIKTHCSSDTMNIYFVEAVSEEHVLPAIYVGFAASILGNM